MFSSVRVRSPWDCIAKFVEFGLPKASHHLNWHCFFEALWGPTKRNYFLFVSRALALETIPIICYKSVTLCCLAWLLLWCHFFANWTRHDFASFFKVVSWCRFLWRLSHEMTLFADISFCVSDLSAWKKHSNLDNLRTGHCETRLCFCFQIAAPSC